MAKSKGGASFLDSPFVRVQTEVRQGPELRRPLISKIEKHFGGKVITYFASFYKVQGMVADEDAEMLESLLASEHADGKVILIVNSAGGQGMAAERIANICRCYSKDRFEVIVPHMAKSAATMICFGASTIHMGDTAELGPVDPQLRYKDSAGELRQISAEEYVRSYNDLVQQACMLPGPHIEPFLQQLERYDARLVEQLRSAQSLAEDISIRLLKSSMMKGLDDDVIKKQIAVLLKQEITHAHGRMITPAEAKSCGLNIKTIDLHSEIWNTIWELYVRSNWCVTTDPGPAKLIESVKSSVAS